MYQKPSFFYVPKTLLLLSYWYNCPWYWPTVENRCQDLLWRVFHSNSISVTALKWSNIGRQNPKSLERGFSFVAAKTIAQRKFSGDSINFPYFGVCTREFVLDYAISFTAVYLVSVTGKHSVKESFSGNCILNRKLCLFWLVLWRLDSSPLSAWWCETNPCRYSVLGLRPNY